MCDNVLTCIMCLPSTHIIYMPTYIMCLHISCAYLYIMCLPIYHVPTCISCAYLYIMCLPISCAYLYIHVPTYIICISQVLNFKHNIHKEI